MNKQETIDKFSEDFNNELKISGGIIPTTAKMVEIYRKKVPRYRYYLLVSIIVSTTIYLDNAGITDPAKRDVVMKSVTTKFHEIWPYSTHSAFDLKVAFTNLINTGKSMHELTDTYYYATQIMESYGLKKLEAKRLAKDIKVLVRLEKAMDKAMKDEDDIESACDAVIREFKQNHPYLAHELLKQVLAITNANMDSIDGLSDTPQFSPEDRQGIVDATIESFNEL